MGLELSFFLSQVGAATKVFLITTEIFRVVNRLQLIFFPSIVTEIFYLHVSKRVKEKNHSTLLLSLIRKKYGEKTA